MADLIWFARNQRTTTLILLATLLSACGGGGGDGGSASTDSGVGVVLGSNNTGGNTDGSSNGPATVVGVTTQSSITISGTVIDGPVTDTLITIRDANNAIVTVTRSDALARYNVQIPTNSVFPLTITASGGTNMVTNTAPSFILVSAIMSPIDVTANLNPFTTLIVKTAAKMPGGLNPANLVTANETVLTVFNAGLDTDRVPNPITTPITNQSAASVIKSSEALAETIRRNPKVLRSVLGNVGEEDMISSLSADLTDGTLDGSGNTGTDPRISSVTSIVFGQVLIESLSNELKVNEELSVGSLSNAISVTFPTSAYNLDELPTNMGILSNIRTALAAAAVIAPSVALTQLETTINTLNAGSLPTEIAAILPSELTAALGDAITQLVNPGQTAVEVVNEIIGTAYAADAPAVNLTLLNIVAASASDHDASRGRLPENAIDGNLDTKWTAVTMPQWFTADLGATQSVSHVRMRVYVNENGANASYAVDISQDNMSWTNVLANAKPVAGAGWVDAVLPAVSARYVRIRLDSTNANDYTNLSELQLYGQILPASISAVSASTYDAERERIPSLATDGNLSSKWTALSLPQWLMVDLGSIQSISGINMKIYIADSGRSANYSLDISSDKSAWNTVIANSAIDTSTGWVQASFTPSTGRYVRLRLDSTNTADYVNLSEIMVYAQAVQNSASPSDDISNSALTLSWQPNTGSILGYKVYFGTSASTVNTELSDIANTLTASFNPALPAMRYDSWYTLRLLPGDSACFKVRAYNADGLSSWSSPICGTITEAAG